MGFRGALVQNLEPYLPAGTVALPPGVSSAGDCDGLALSVLDLTLGEHSEGRPVGLKGCRAPLLWTSHPARCSLNPTGTPEEVKR